MSTDAIPILNWLKMLGLLTAGAMALDEAEVRVSALAPALASEFAEWAFSQASVYAVAAECKHFPTFGEIVALLREWCSDHRPRHSAIAAPPAREATGYVLPMPPPEKPARGRIPIAGTDIHPPIRTVEQQLAILRASETVDA